MRGAPRLTVIARAKVADGANAPQITNVATASRPRSGSSAAKRFLAYVLALCVLVLLLDRLFPLPLPDSATGATVVLARDGSPLRAFADDNGIWRYPVTPKQVSPLYLQALLNYEDRWFWKHPGVNPFALARAVGQMVWYRRP